MKVIALYQFYFLYTLHRAPNWLTLLLNELLGRTGTEDMGRHYTTYSLR